MALPEELRDGKVGRFPVWAIGVLIAGAIILFLFIRNRNRNATPEDTDPSVPGDGVLENVDGLPVADFADQLSGNFPSNVSLAPAPQRPMTNAQWLIAAHDFLVGMSKNPFTVLRALQKFLAGEALTEEERALVELATANPNLSLPPEGVNLPPVVTQPAPGTGNPPPTSTPSTEVAPAGVNLYDWASPRGGFVYLFGMYKNDPAALNPTARSYMVWEGPKGSTLIPKFTSARTIRVR